MLEYIPAWLSFEIEQALNEIGPPHVRKKRTTVLRLAEASVKGRSMAQTFAMPDCCSETTWRGRFRRGEKKRPGWSEDEAIQRALKLATERAQYWEDAKVGRSIASARDKLAEAAPAAVSRLITLMAGARRESLQRQAALDILDRTGVVKAQSEPRLQVELTGRDSQKGSRADWLAELEDEELAMMLENLETVSEGGPGAGLGEGAHPVGGEVSG